MHSEWTSCVIMHIRLVIRHQVNTRPLSPIVTLILFLLKFDKQTRCMSLLTSRIFAPGTTLQSKKTILLLAAVKQFC